MGNSMTKMLSIGCLCVAAAFLAGCPKKATTVEPPSAGTQIAGSSTETGHAGSTTTSPFGSDAGTMGAGSQGAGASGALARNVVYFDFDKSDIKPEYADLIAAHARNLTAHPNLKLKLEGNTDERGTREYNIGLGERRAQAVRRAMMLQGVSQSQLTTVSFGAERPAVEGDDEAAWAKNRRVDMVYTP
jgi:peptidoglycan-associated lipoprotein